MIRRGEVKPKHKGVSKEVKLNNLRKRYKLNGDDLLKVIEEMYPKVEYKEGQDLRIENNIKRIITKCWNDVENFKDINSIREATGMPTKYILRYANSCNLPDRRTIGEPDTYRTSLIKIDNNEKESKTKS